MREATLVELWGQVSRSFLPRGVAAAEVERAQNAFLAGALGVFLQLEHAVESGDAASVARAFRRLRRELNLGSTRRGRALTRQAR